MAKSVNITFYPNATAKCSNCGSTYTFGMDVETLSLEVCGNCHPFYTGKETRVDTAGKIEKFEARAAKAGGGEKKTKVKMRKTVQTLADLAPEEEITQEETIAVEEASKKMTKKIANPVE